MKINWTKQQFLNATDLILEFGKSFDLSNDEILIAQAIFRLSKESNERFWSQELLTNYVNLDLNTINNILVKLISKEFISFDDKGTIVVDPLLNKIWHKFNSNNQAIEKNTNVYNKVAELIGRELSFPEKSSLNNYITEDSSIFVDKTIESFSKKGDTATFFEITSTIEKSIIELNEIKTLSENEIIDFDWTE